MDFDALLEAARKNREQLKVGNVTFTWVKDGYWYDIPAEQWDVQAITDGLAAEIKAI